MERLSHWGEVWKEDLCNVEDPFLAVINVRRNLRSRGYVREIEG